MFKSLSSRLWLTYALVISVVLAVVGAVLVVYLLRNPVNQRETSLRLRMAVALVNFGRGGGGGMNVDNLSQTLDAFDENFDVRVIVQKRGGELIYDTRADQAAMPPELEIPELNQGSNPQQPNNGGGGNNPPALNAQFPLLTFKDSDEITWLYVSRPFQGEIDVIVASPRPTGNLVQVFADDVFMPLFVAGLVAMALALVMAFIISRSVADPLQRISDAALSVGKGKYSQIDIKGPKEVQQLGQAFNEMTERVQATQQSQRDFVANISHELKTPLTSIQGFAQAIVDGTAQDPTTRTRAATVIYDEAGRMHRMVVDLLDLAQIDAGTTRLKRELVDLRALLHAVSEKLNPQSQASGVMLIANLELLPRMIGDGDRLAQVFTNLIENAIKHTPKGGTVTVGANENIGRVEVHIRDTGIGVDPAELERIFERFYQVDKARKGGGGRGVGLGLAITAEIVHLHGGQIRAESQPGKGSTFIVSLPIVRSDDETLVGNWG